MSKEPSSLEIVIEKFIDSRLRLLEPKKMYSRPDIKSVLTMPRNIPMKTCESSNVHSFGYHEKSRTLRVIFKGGGEYRYLNVSKEGASVMERSPSKGKAMTQIKILHLFVKINKDSFGEQQAEEKTETAS